MDVLGWLWWMVKGLLGLVWFLIGGWISALLQIFVLALAVFIFKYGWQRGPLEMWRAGEGARRFVWGWLRGSAGWRAANASAGPARVEVKTLRVKELGDINISTLMSLAMFLGLALLARVG